MRREPEAAVEGGGSRALTPSGTLRELLAALSRVASRQRAAILARDAASLNRIAELLARLLTEVSRSAEASGDDAAVSEAGDARRIAALARHVQEQMRINHALIENGMGMADHFVAAAAEAAAACRLALFSGVA